MSASLSDPPRNFHVMIVGAGLGGLLMTILLNKAGISCELFEKNEQIRPLGAALSLAANILPVFEQLGLLEEVMAISYPSKSIEILKEDGRKIGAFSFLEYEAQSGYPIILFARAALYDLLLSKIPSDKVHMKKRVLSMTQSEDGVLIRTQDGCVHHGDILIGADGVYSAVRQNLYEMLAKENKLPKSDSQGLEIAYSCLLGTTKSLDPEKYPLLKDKQSHFLRVLGKDKPHSWYCITVPNNVVCWAVFMQTANNEEVKLEMQRSSSWDADRNLETIKEVYNFPSPLGGTIGELIDATGKENISKVFLEEKLFETWHSGRTVLIGDAVHKFLPSGGQGAMCAMQDAVILANCLYDMQEPTYKNVRAAFKDYKSQRESHVKISMERSVTMGKLMYGQKFMERQMRKLVYNMPLWLQSRGYLKMCEYRPQVMFLPQAPNPGKLPVLPQKPCKRYNPKAASAAAIVTSIDTPVADATPATVEAPKAEEENKDDASIPAAVAQVAEPVAV